MKFCPNKLSNKKMQHFLEINVHMFDRKKSRGIIEIIRLSLKNLSILEKYKDKEEREMPASVV
jgi:hypothetical protein